MPAPGRLPKLDLAEGKTDMADLIPINGISKFTKLFPAGKAQKIISNLLKRTILLLMLMLGLLFCGPAFGAEVGFPPPRGAVNDFAGIIDAASVQTCLLYTSPSPRD